MGGGGVGGRGGRSIHGLTIAQRGRRGMRRAGVSGAVFRTTVEPRDNWHVDDSIVGREDELAASARSSPRRSGRASLLLSGEAGIGKTTLWRAGVEQAEAAGHVILSTRPLEAEAKLAYAGVGDLLAGVARGPRRAARAAGACAPSGAPARDAAAGRRRRAGGLARLPRRRCARSRGSQPVLVAVDDVQWLDSASARVLAYAARRLAERVAFLLALRAEARAELGYAAGARLPRLRRARRCGRSRSRTCTLCCGSDSASSCRGRPCATVHDDRPRQPVLRPRARAGAGRGRRHAAPRRARLAARQACAS